MFSYNIESYGSMESLRKNMTTEKLKENTKTLKNKENRIIHSSWASINYSDEKENIKNKKSLKETINSATKKTGK